VKPAEFHPEAEAELVEAVAFYDAEGVSLGTEFATAVEVAVDFVRGNPRCWHTTARSAAALAGAALSVRHHLS
jgi:hypothetical protein